MSDFTMPYQKEKELDEKSGSTRDKRIYKPLPDKAGQSINNDVVIPLFSPHNWKLFNPTPEDAQKYGMVGSGLVSMNPSDPVHTFYFRLPVHNVQNFSHSDGSVKRFAQVICPIALNRYLIESLGRGPLFNSPRCAFCEQEQRHWDAFNARWETCGTDKSTLSKEGYWKFIDGDLILSAEREGTRKFGVDTRFVISIFDHAKFVGTRPLDDGETGVEHQIWFAPKSIKQGLLQLYEAGAGGFRFFKPTEQGFPILYVNKNTKECKATDMRPTKYDVGFANNYHPYPPEWLEYLQNSGAMVDPSDFVYLVTYEEARYHVASQQSVSSNVVSPSAQPAAGAPPAGVPGAVGAPPVAFSPPGAAPASAGVPPGSVSPDGYAAPQGVLPQGAPPVDTVSPGAPQGAPPVAPQGAPIPAQPPAAAGAPPTATPGGPVPVVGPVTTQGAPAFGAPPAGTPPTVQPPSGVPGASAAPTAAPPAVPGAGVPAGAPVAVPGAPPATTAPATGTPPDRTSPAGGDPPGTRRKW